MSQARASKSPGRHGRAGRGTGPAPPRAALPLLLLLAGCAGGLRYPLPPLPSTDAGAADGVVAAHIDPAPVCYDCFWQYQPAGAREDLARRYARDRSGDPLVLAERALVIGRLTRDSAAVCAAGARFAELAATERSPRRRLLALETVAFLSGECHGDPTATFARAAVAALQAGERWKASVYRAIAHDDFHPVIGPAPIERALRVPPGATGYVLGASTIRVDSSWTIVSQLERIGRDWLSNQIGWSFPDTAGAASLLDHHEGHLLRQLLAAAPARLLPVTGVLAIHVMDNRWLAADDSGVFRYQVLPDKVQYPTTRARDGVALLVDTHGISALVEPSVRLGANLVVGCGDYTAKMQAAFHLARRGIDVWYPEDRFAGDVLGYDAPGILLGSAPIHRDGNTAVIGNQPVAFRFDETVVAGTTHMIGNDRYYDAPARYFGRLAGSLPIRVDTVDVDAPGRSGEVVDRARRLGANVIAVRVWNDTDSAAVAAWLRESPRHRAVLFHSMAYPAGEAILDGFPRQTTFGDARPRFDVSAKPAASGASDGSSFHAEARRTAEDVKGGQKRLGGATASYF